MGKTLSGVSIETQRTQRTHAIYEFPKLRTQHNDVIIG